MVSFPVWYLLPNLLIISTIRGQRKLNMLIGQGIPLDKTQVLTPEQQQKALEILEQSGE